MNSDSSLRHSNARSRNGQPRLEPDEQVAVEAMEPEELAPEEEEDRLHLERRVERAFYEAGKALRELRDRRLYRSTHRTFEEYCRERFGHTRQKSNYLIAGATVYENLTTNCCQILPTSEYQVRAVAADEPELQVEAWQQAVEIAGGKVPSGRIVKDVVQRIRERTPVPNPYRVGEVCRIIARDNPELRGKGGCWGIVSQVHEWSCTVNTWNGEYRVRIEHLKSCEYSSTERQQVEELGIRMTQLYETGSLDEGALWVLKGLEKLNRPFLTPLEEKLLALLEQEYGLTAS